MRTLGLSLVVLVGAIAGAGIMRLLDGPPPAVDAPRNATPAEPTPGFMPPPPAIRPEPETPASRKDTRRAGGRDGIDLTSRRAIAKSRFDGPRAIVRARRPEIDSFAVSRSRAEEEPVAIPAPQAPPSQVPAPLITVLTPPAHAEPEHAAPVPPTPPEPHRVTLNAGILIPVRLVHGLSTERSKPGDFFIATLDQELIADDFVVAERGARVEGRVIATDPGDRGSGVPALTLALTQLHTSDGQAVRIRTDSFERYGAPARGTRNGNAAKARRNSSSGIAATLPPETHIRFRLGAPVTLTEHAR